MSEEGFLARWSRRKVGCGEPSEPAAAEVPTPAASSPALSAAVSSTPVASMPALTATVPPGPAPGASAPAADPKASEQAIPLPTMADVAALTRSSDYSRFVAPGVDRAVSNAAMKKLFFGDPHFNVMDGLDTYIGDYGRADPIPPAMLRAMNQASSLGLFDEQETPATDRSSPSPTPLPSTSALSASASASAPTLAAESDAPAQARPDGSPCDGVAQLTIDDPQVAPAERAETAQHADPDLRLQQDDAARRPGAGQGARD